MTTCPTCGQRRKEKPRSIDHHRRLFGIISVFYSLWPESHPEKFDNAEQLRKWLLLKANHKEVIRIDLAGADPAAAVIVAEAAMRASGAYARARIVDGELLVFRPRSIAWDKLSQAEFAKISEEIEHILTAETGIEIKDVETTGIGI